VTQAALDFTAATKRSLCDQLEAYLRQHPNQWIDARTVLMPIGGFGGWRTRLSDLRRQRNMNIENRNRRVTDGLQTWTVSEYRFVNGR